MKKLTALLLCFVLLVPSAVFASDFDSAISRVCGVGIMGNVADGDFRADDNITRAEFTAVALRMLSIFTSPQSQTEFSDVPSEHWASGHIAMASRMGLINGRGNGIFAPEDSVTYPEAVKIIVCALGREDAMQTKDYPSSYLAQAGALGITKGLDFKDAPLTRAEVALLVDNALDVRPLEPVYGKDAYELSGETLYEKLSRLRDTMFFSGILYETENVSLEYDAKPENGEVKVDNEYFRTERNFDAFLGQSVDVYYTLRGSVKTVVSLTPSAGVNTVYTFSPDEVEYSPEKLVYTDENGKEKNYKIASDAKFVLNGDRVETPVDMGHSVGEYVLIDNNDNSVADVVSITKAESFIVKTVSLENYAFYFDNNRTYHGRNGFVAALDDEEKKIVITDKNGNEMGFDAIAEGDTVSIIGNKDDSFVRILVNSESVEGAIEEMSDEHITVGGKTYPVATDDEGDKLFSPYLGMEGVFAIDAFGYCIGTFGTTPDKFVYGYVTDARTGNGMDNSLQIKIISGTEPEKDVKISAGTETVSYWLQNSEIQVLSLADVVKFGNNPVDGIGEKKSVKDLSPSEFIGKIAGYTLNSEGKINAINIYSLPANFTSYEFNADIFAFGGERANRGFIVDSSSVIVCIPSELRNEDDYGVRVKITDNNGVNVYGVKGIYESEPNSEEAWAEPVNILIVKADMDSSRPETVDEDAEICIVGQVTKRLDENGDEFCVCELLRGSEKKTYDVPSDSDVYTEVRKLRKGDLIQINTNSKGHISGVNKLASVQGLTDYGYEENLYGYVEDIKYNTYDYLSNSMVDRMYVNCSNMVLPVKIYRSEGQNIYLYDRKSGYIYPATVDDVKAASYYGDDASKVFAIMDANDAKVIVLIKD